MYSNSSYGNYNGIWYASTGKNANTGENAYINGDWEVSKGCTSTNPWTNPNPWTSPSTNPWPSSYELGTPCAGGHITNPENIEYVDGVVISYCSTCGSRIIISRLPGGISFLKIRTLLGSLLSLEEGSNTGIDRAELLAVYSEIIEELEKELEQIQQAQKLADIAAKMLKKVHHGSNENT